MNNKRIQPNPTDAKTLALHFLELTNNRLERNTIQRTIIQVKNVLAEGYSYDDIVKTIDYVLARKAGVYSFGYIAASIEDVIKEIRLAEEKDELDKRAEDVRRQMIASAEQQRGKVDDCDESTERNREKAKRLGIQPRFGAKFNFDMFEAK